MKPNNQHPPAIMSGAQKSVAFTMQVNGKAFKTLADGIYEDKILAPIRELCINARDIHDREDVQQKRPFDVSLPTWDDLNFRIRDYGTGLSEEQIIGDPEKGIAGLYTTYFHSTKEEDQSQVGYLGIGSKSPFSYAGTFIVTSYYNGRKQAYLMTMDDIAGPTASLVDDVETDEPNGLEISFSVKDKDIALFERKIKNFFAYWPKEKHPNFLKPIEIPDYVTPAYQGNGWYITKNEFYSDTLPVIMGGINYGISRSKFADQFPYISEIQNLVLVCELREVHFTASREYLELNDFTMDALVKKLKNYEVEQVQELQAEIDRQPTRFSAYLKIINALRHPVIKHLKSALNFRGMPLDMTMVQIGQLKLPCAVNVKYWCRDRYGHVNMDRLKNDEFESIKMPRSYDDDDDVLDMGNVMLFVDPENDFNHKSIRIVNAYLRDNMKSKGCAFLIDAESRQEIEAVYDELPYIDVATLPVPQMKRTQRKSSFAKNDIWNSPNIRLIDSGKPVIQPIDASQEVLYYVPVRYNYIQSHTFYFENMNAYMTLFKEMGLVKHTEVYGVYPMALRRVEKAANWVNICDLVHDNIDVILTHNNMDVAKKEYDAAYEFVHSNYELRHAFALDDDVWTEAEEDDDVKKDELERHKRIWQELIEWEPVKSWNECYIKATELTDQFDRRSLHYYLFRNLIVPGYLEAIPDTNTMEMFKKYEQPENNDLWNFIKSLPSYYRRLDFVLLEALMNQEKINSGNYELVPVTASMATVA